MPSGCVNYNDLILLLSEKSYTLFGDFDWIFFIFVSKKWAFNLCCVHLELFECTCSESICAYKTYFPASFQVLISEFGTGCGLSRSLETDEHDNIGFALDEFIRLVFTTKHLDQLIDDKFNDGVSQVYVSFSLLLFS